MSLPIIQENADESNVTVNNNSSFISTSSITVSVRVRPVNKAELEQMEPEEDNRHFFKSKARLSVTQKEENKNYLRRVVHCINDKLIIFDPPKDKLKNDKTFAKPFGKPDNASKRHRDERFYFDRVFGEQSTQEDIYLETTRPLIQGVLEGFNATVFAYGATGCGKTHTISGSPEQPGIIYLAMQELFDKIAELSEENIFEITLSYLEVYNECIYDLLIPEGNKKYPLIMREDSKDGISLPELSQHYPSSVDEVMKLVLQGNQNRTISPTLANAVSSRSHAVLQVTIRQRPKTSNISTRYTMATLSLIDLAGSERASATQNRGTRMVEGANINRSLLALGSCINALCRKSKNVHIPYRNSKLTRLLKFSLGGNCRTVMIVCISPTSTFYEETLNTLNYANRAKNINTKVSKNSTNVDLHVTQYTQVIANLRKEIGQLKIKLSEKSQIPQRSIANGGPISRVHPTNQVQSKNYEDFEEKRSQFKNAVASLLANENQREKISTQLKSLDQRIHILQEWLNSETPSESNSSFGAYYNGVKNAKIELEKRKLSLEKEMRQLSTQTNQKTIANRSLDELLRNASMKYDAAHRSILELDLKLIQQQFLANKHEHSYNDVKHFSDQSNELLSTFMSINSQCLFGLKDVLNKCESQSIDTSVLNNIYMKSIEVFTKTNQLISKPSENQASLTSSPSRLSISSKPSVTDHLLHKLNPRSRPIPSAMASYKSPSAPKKSVRIDAPSPQRRFKPRVSEPPRPVTKFGNFKPKVDLFDIKKQSFISSTDLKKSTSSTPSRAANTPSKPPVSARHRASVLPRLPVTRVPRQPSTPQPKRRILNTVSETGSQTSSPTQTSKRPRPPTSFLPRPSTLGTPNKRTSPSTRRLSEGIPSKPHFEGRPVFGKY